MCGGTLYCFTDCPYVLCPGAAAHAGAGGTFYCGGSSLLEPLYPW